VASRLIILGVGLLALSFLSPGARAQSAAPAPAADPAPVGHIGDQDSDGADSATALAKKL